MKLSRFFFLFFMMGWSLISDAYTVSSDPTKSSKSASPFSFDREALDQWYEARQGAPLWFSDNKLSPEGKQATSALASAQTHGIGPQRYQDLLAQIGIAAELNPSELANLDYHLTLAVLDYIALIGGERTNLKNLDRQLYIKVKELNEVALLRKSFEYQKQPWLEQVLPHHSQYQALQKTLMRYLEKQKQGGWPKLPLNIKAQLGDRHIWVTQLRQQLVMQDAMDGEDITSDLFDLSIQKALKVFQLSHGLKPDGNLGKETLEALNIPVEKRIEQITLNLERWRWLPQDLGDKYVIVNIPTYELYGVKDGKMSLKMPIIVGKAYRKTPIFNANMTHIVLNPSWTVPQSIAVKDKVPLFSKTPSLVSKGNYRIFTKDGAEVSPEDVNWGAYHGSSSLPYVIKQSPGAHNALGKIKFHIQNPFSIYLHGTPNQKLFSAYQRAFSSGCIRVAFPLELASFVLDSPQWSRKVLETETKGDKTKSIPLKTSLPVYLTYMTVWVRDDGRASFAKDIYGKDSSVAKFVEKNLNTPSPRASF
ncbi:MAG: L,D-transpeptidase family protein [Alphaproteobacteria bacterium]